METNGVDVGEPKAASREKAKATREATRLQRRAAQAGFFLSTDEVLSRYKVSRVTWWEWRRKGLAPQPVKLGGVARYSIEALLAFEAERTAAAGAAAA